MALIEDVFVPLYLHHRYAVDSAVTVLGGQDYIYAFRGDGRTPTRWMPAAAQRSALDALMKTLSLKELALPSNLLSQIPPRPPGFGATRELFPRTTGSIFDPISPAVVATTSSSAACSRIRARHAWWRRRPWIRRCQGSRT